MEKMSMKVSSALRIASLVAEAEPESRPRISSGVAIAVSIKAALIITFSVDESRIGGAA
jgi:hypothetical protein